MKILLEFSACRGNLWHKILYHENFIVWHSQIESDRVDWVKSMHCNSLARVRMRLKKCLFKYSHISATIWQQTPVARSFSDVPRLADVHPCTLVAVDTLFFFSLLYK